MRKKKQISELSKEQIELQPVYRDEWIMTGFDTSPCDRKEAEKWIKKAYTVAKLKPPQPEHTHWALSPKQAIDTMSEMYDVSRSDCFNAFSFGQHDAGWLSFYDYFRRVVGLKTETAPLVPLMNLAHHCGWFMLFDKAVCLCERPIELHLIAGGKKYSIVNTKPKKAIMNCQLHRDGGPAILYRDGYAEYMLNGVKVTKEIAETPWNKLDPMLLFKSDNASVRREIVTKVGIERLMEASHAKIIDKKDGIIGGPYELMVLDIGDKQNRPYLKMINPTLGTYCIQGVPPGTKTVMQALEFRNGTKELPTVLT